MARKAQAKAVTDVLGGPDPVPAPLRYLTDDETARLLTAVHSAHENNGTLRLFDGADRHWFVGTDIVGNHSTVLIQVRRGERERHTNLSTARCTPDTAAAAIAELDAAFAA